MNILRNNYGISAVICLIILISVSAVQGQNSFTTLTPEKILSFAESLYQQEDYFRAESEYFRYLFTKPEQGRYDSVFLKIALCRIRRQKFALARDALQDFIGNSRNGLLRSKAAILDLYARYLDGRYPELTGINQDGPNPYRTVIFPEDLHRKRLLSTLSYGRQFQWRKAGRELSGIMPGSIPLISTGDLNRITALFSMAAVRPVKSPALAGILSALVPGLGRVYNGRLGDGIFSFVMISLCGTSTYHAFDQDRNVLGGVLGITTAVLYAGNIYGSATGAQIDNREANLKTLEQLDTILPEKVITQLFTIRLSFQ